MRKKFLALLLLGGVVLGYGHAFASFAHHGWDHRPACHRHVDPPAP